MTNSRTNNLVIVVVMVAWAALIIVLSARGVFATDSSRPPLPLLLSFAVPPILFLVAYSLSAKVRATSLAIDLRLLTALQAWRVIGGVFLILMSFHLLPGTFAWPAGVGDLIVGGYAPFVVLSIARRTPGWRTHVILLNVLGLLDLVTAIASGVLSGSSPIGVLHGPVSTDIMQELPLSLIPTFAVPAWVIMHVLSFLKLRRGQIE
jgi:hypothetical protein